MSRRRRGISTVRSKRPRARANGEGSIYKRSSDGLWVAATYLPLGKRKVVYGRTKEAVRLKLDKVKSDVLTGNAPRTDERQTVEDYMTYWLEATRSSLRPSSYRVYESMVRTHIIPRLGPRQLTKLGVPDLERFFAETPLAPKSVRMVKAILSAAIRDAVKWGYLSRNPVAYADSPRIVAPDGDFIDAEEATRISHTFVGHPLGHLVTTAIGTGLRQGELLALRWADVDLDGATALVRGTMQPNGTIAEPKTKSSHRRVPLPGFAADALRQQSEVQNARRLLTEDWSNELGLVFTNGRGAPLLGTTVTSQFQKRLVEAGLKRRRFHELRHAYSSLMLAQGVDIRTIMELLGHSNLHTTATVYTHVVPELARDAADRLGELFS